MHIYDGLLNIPTTVITSGISYPLLAYAFRKVEKGSEPSGIPLMGLSGAFIFAAQLISFPVIGGTSVHITGAFLLTLLLGPFTAFLITSLVLVMLALLFQHGGLLSLGANILNMAAVHCFLGNLFLKKTKFRENLFLIGFVSFFLVIISAVLCALELGFSGAVPLKNALISMNLAHLFAGIVEAFVTVTIFKTIGLIKPDILNQKRI